MLYGKWRPRTFAEVAGQDHIVTTLRNAVATGQVAHAYLFTGPRGTGKTTSARILAKAVNCHAPVQGDPCNQCPACEAINRGAALDLIEMDAASNRGIEDVRDLRERIAYAPSDLKKKVYLLDEAHMLTAPAFNALLKTLEEPPPHAILILATTEAHDLPKTIISRCQRFDFRRVADPDIIRRLDYIAGEEGFHIPPEAMRQVARVARGGLRDAITLMEQVVAQYGDSPSTEQVEESLGIAHDSRTDALADAILARDLPLALGIAREVSEGGVEFQRFTRNTVEVLRGRVTEALAQRDKPVTQLVVPLLRAIDCLANADFKRDPASPVPLELAVASAILGSINAPEPAGAPAPAQGAAPAPVAERAQAGRRPAAGSAPPDATLSREDAFLQRLRNECRMADTKVAALLSDSCVVSMEGPSFVLGFYYKFHLDAVEKNNGRSVIEEAATRILERPVTLVVQEVERPSAPRRAPRGGHLVAAARVIEGATPVVKEE